MLPLLHPHCVLESQEGAWLGSSHPDFGSRRSSSALCISPLVAHNDLLANTGPHKQQWSHKITSPGDIVVVLICVSILSGVHIEMKSPISDTFLSIPVANRCMTCLWNHEVPSLLGTGCSCPCSQHPMSQTTVETLVNARVGISSEA